MLKKSLDIIPSINEKKDSRKKQDVILKNEVSQYPGGMKSWNITQPREVFYKNKCS